MRTLVVAAASLSALLSAGAQNRAPRAINTNPPAAVGAATSAGGTSAATPSVTGVPRYRAGFRGPRDEAAAATPGDLSRVGADGAIDAGATTLPVARLRFNDLGLPAGTPIAVRLAETVDSGHVKNGDTLKGALEKPVGSMPAGTPVELTVVSAAAAGQMKSSGELSVQVVRIGGKEALSQVITAEGKEGAKLTADGAPERGTEAQLGPDQPLVLPAA